MDTARSLGHLAACCVNTGDLARAKALFERALSIYDTALGRTHPNTAAILHMLANLATQAGQSRRAAALNERATTAAAAARHQECGHCGRTDVPGSKYCSQCKAVWFCNEQCQKQAWKEHQKHCHAPPEAPEEEEKGHACGQCGKAGAPLHCSQCEAAWYCNASCQLLAWKQHRKQCHAPPKAPAALKGGASRAAA